MKDIASIPRGVARAPLDEDWPEAELEHLGQCPVCCSSDRILAYTGLRDKVFFCAPGSWESWRCNSCNVVYLDPRPTTESIGRAYQTYYTHDDSAPAVAGKLSILGRLRRSVANSYLNRRFGYRLRPALPLGWLAFTIKPRRALSTDHYYRHLPAPRGRDDRLLDIGCGSGDFLQVARDDLGYVVEGLEIDPQARAVARRRGLTVHGGMMPGSGLAPGSYYQVTLSHVLEHLHDPFAALQEMFSLLKPGGRVWIAVPNIGAASLARFGNNSRLLEPPRHLVMFDPDSLRQILGKARFVDVTLLPQVDSHTFVYNQSWMIENGLDPYASSEQIIPKHERNVAAFGHAPLSLAKNNEIFVITGKRPG